jgi:pilus assembly protein Flp/PilA
MIKKFINNKSGATVIEYALIVAIMALGLIVVLSNLSGHVSSEFSEVSGVLK